MIQETIKKLELLGRMPDSSEDNISSEKIDEYATLIKEAKVPVNQKEAEILIKLFPEYELFGIEWSLLHLFETVYNSIPLEIYKSIIEKCPSEEWKDTLLTRLK
jgi:hypothetical protein